MQPVYRLSWRSVFARVERGVMVVFEKFLKLADDEDFELCKQLPPGVFSTCMFYALMMLLVFIPFPQCIRHSAYLVIRAKRLPIAKEAQRMRRQRRAVKALLNNYDTLWVSANSNHEASCNYFLCPDLTNVFNGRTNRMICSSRDIPFVQSARNRGYGTIMHYVWRRENCQ